MELLKSHIVEGVEGKIRFIDYAMGIFDGFETRNSIKSGIRKNRFLLNGESAVTGAWMKNGDRIDLMERKEIPKAYAKNIEIVYEDDFLAIVHKPAGLVVSGNQFKTLENCLIDQLKKSTAEDALGWALPIHRLDASTSGLVIFAKTVNSRRLLGEMLEKKSIQKIYHAVVHGIPMDGEINGAIEGKTATSRLKLIRSVPSLKNEHVSLVQLEPITGRTHQLRIHCQSIGNCIVGDQKYMNADGTFRNKGLFLAATKVAFIHPCTAEFVAVEIPLPHKFESLLNRELNRAKRYQ